MTTRQQWLQAGLDLVAEAGYAALRIDRLAVELGLSKGSFYHHFAGISGYRLDLLDYYEKVCTTRHIEIAEAEEGLPPLVKLEQLRTSIFSDPDVDNPDLDIAMRAWAAQDDDARAVQERVDRRRVDYLESLWLQATSDPDQAYEVSRTIYLLLVGSQHVLPPLPAAELGRLYDRVLRGAGAVR